MLPNKLIRSYLQALEDLLGRNGVNAILNVSALSDWIENYPPEDDVRAVSFETFTQLQSSIEDIYGDRAGQNLSRQAARSSFADAGAGLLKFGESKLSENDPSAIKASIQAFINLFDPEDSGHAGWKGSGKEMEIYFETCPNCVERASTSPVCKACAGWIEALFNSMKTVGTIDVSEISCRAAGDSRCTFLIQSQ